MQYQGKLDANKLYIADSQNQTTLTPTPTVIPQIDQDIRTWNTYINKKNSFSIKYPANAQRITTNALELNFTAGAPINPYQTGLIDQYTVSVFLSPDQNLSSVLTDNTNTSKEKGIAYAVKKINIIPSSSATQFIAYGGQDGVNKNVYTYLKLKNGKLLEIAAAFSNADKYEAQVNQMLSTFSFIDITPTLSCTPRPACLDATPRCMIAENENMCPKPTEAVICTQEAKMCPNGSAVGRSGPNCEFAPCPSSTP